MEVKPKTEKKSKIGFGVMYKTIGFFILFSIIISIVLFCVLHCFSNPENLIIGFTAKEYLSIAQTIAIALAVLTGAGTAGMAFRSHQIKEVDAINKRFNEAVTAMASDNKYISMQGIYALERLAKNAPNKHERQNVVRILCGYLREHRNVAQIEAEREANPDEYDSISRLNHVLESIAVVVTNLKNTFGEVKIYLPNTNLDNFCFVDVNLKNSHFCNSSFLKGDFINVNLNGAELFGVIFRCAKFYDVTFEKALLTGANFEKAECEGANFRNAKLRMANFCDAKLRNANFENADLTVADFYNADLRGANLKGAIHDNSYVFFENACVDNDTIGLENSEILQLWEINRDNPNKWILVPREE